MPNCASARVISYFNKVSLNEKYVFNIFQKIPRIRGLGSILPKYPRLIEQKIIEFIVDMRNRGKGYAAIHNYVASVLAFYKINDVLLNVSKINKFVPAQKKVRKDRAYTRIEISKFLEITDERMRVVVLLMTSSGVRVGSLPLLRVRNLEDSRLTVYENDREEYFTFITLSVKRQLIHIWTCVLDVGNRSIKIHF